MAACPRCVARGKAWGGDAPKCAFTSGVFSGDNWQCATMNALRELVEDKPEARWSDDQWAAVIPVESLSDHIVMSWYKHRGCTELAYIVGTKEPLTLEQAEMALDEAARWTPGDTGGAR